MVISLYNGKDVNAEPDLGLIQNLVSRGFVEGQYPPGKVKMNVVKADSVGEKFKNAVKKAKNAQYLNDADLVLVFQAPKSQAPEEEFSEKISDAGDGEEIEVSAKEEVSESLKVQDLSKSQGLKPVKPSCGCKCGKKKPVKEEEEKKPAPRKRPSKNDLEEKDPGKEQAPGDDSGKKDPPERKDTVEEAEMSATGDELKVKIADVIKRVLYLPKNEDVEFVSLDGYSDGNDVFFAKLSFKD